MKNNNVAKVQNAVIISNRDQETQTKPETSEEILESSDVSLVAVLKFNYYYTVYTQCNVCSMYFLMLFVFYKFVFALGIICNSGNRFSLHC